MRISGKLSILLSSVLIAFSAMGGVGAGGGNFGSKKLDRTILMLSQATCDQCFTFPERVQVLGGGMLETDDGQEALFIPDTEYDLMITDFGEDNTLTVTRSDGVPRLFVAEVDQETGSVVFTFKGIVAPVASATPTPSVTPTPTPVVATK